MAVGEKGQSPGEGEHGWLQAWLFFWVCVCEMQAHVPKSTPRPYTGQGSTATCTTWYGCSCIIRPAQGLRELCVLVCVPKQYMNERRQGELTAPFHSMSFRVMPMSGNLFKCMQHDQGPHD